MTTFTALFPTSAERARRAERMHARCSSGSGATFAFRLGSLSADNLLPDNLNPVVLASTASADARVAHDDAPNGGGAPQSAVRVLVDRRTQDTYRRIAVSFAPLRVVLDLALLHALSNTRSQRLLGERTARLAHEQVRQRERGEAKRESAEAPL